MADHLERQSDLLRALQEPPGQRKDAFEEQLPYGFPPGPEADEFRFAGDYYRESEHHVTRGVSLAQASLDPPFPGDYYREPDHVTKGVSLAHASLDPSLCYDGDYYREPEIYKGVAMAPPSLCPGGLDSAWLSSGKLGDSHFGADEIGGYEIEKAENSYINTATERFSQADVPPNAPTDKYFKFEVTTMQLQLTAGTLPCDIGNELLDFMATTIATIVKVSRKKFAIKANVFVDGIMCTLKIRTYFQEGTRYAVEFQRRSGDCIIFNSTYQQAVKYMKYHFEVASPTAQAPEIFVRPPVPPMDAFLSQVGLAPLLDMAGLQALPELQAESAVALAEKAQDGSTANSLCTAQAFEEFKTLLKSDRMDVAYPTAQLMTFLAQDPEASTYFLDHGLLPLLIQKVHFNTCKSTLVQQQLALVLHTAIIRCASSLSEQAASEVIGDLTEAIQDVSDEQVCAHLKEAQSLLKSQRSRGSSSWS